MFKTVVPLLAVTALIASSQQVQATILLPGTLPPGIPISQTGTLAGLTLVATIDGTFTTNGSIAGTTQSQVFLDPAGTYDFTIQVTSVTNGTLERVTTFNYAGFTTDVYDVLETGGVPFLLADRGPTGATVGSSTTIPTGSFSDILLIKTNATNFDSLGNIGESDGITANTPAFEPLAVVPEPASLALLSVVVLGLGGAASYRRLRARFIPA
jgi:hypothetical protein